MGRGDDQEGTTPAIPRKRNPFRQEIEDLSDEELAEYRLEVKEREREERLKAAGRQTENIPVPDEAARLATPEIIPEEALAKRKEYLSSQFSKIPSMEHDFSPVSLMAEVGGFVEEDYQVEISSSGGQLLYRIHFPKIKDQAGLLSYETDWERLEEREITDIFLPGEEAEAEKAINAYIQENVTKTRKRAKEALEMQDKLKTLLSDQGVMSFDPNSPAYGLLDRIGAEIFLDHPIYKESYPEKDLDYNKSGKESRVLRLFPEYYKVETGKTLRGPGEASYWLVRAPDGDELSSGNATGMSADEVKAAADKVIAESVEKSITAIKEEHKRFKKREEIFKDLNARVLMRGLRSAYSEEYINLASGAGEIKNLKRKDLGDGWTAVVGEQTFNFSPDGLGGKIKQRDSELLLVFKDGELQHQFNEGLMKYSDEATGAIGRFLPGLRKRVLLSRAKKAIESSPGFRGGLTDM